MPENKKDDTVKYEEPTEEQLRSIEDSVEGAPDDWRGDVNA